MQVRDRVVELRRVRASELEPHPLNWRVHPQHQRDALRGLLAEVGYVDALLARRDDGGGLVLIDGHLRAETTPDALVPVLVLDVDEAEAAKILASLDPLAALAGADTAKLDALLREVQTGCPELGQMLSDLASETGVIPPDVDGDIDEEADDERDRIRERYQVLVECGDEEEQAGLLERLDGEGYTCRALIA